jgi:ABC-type transport system involved in multi-copper enzyme maturation permease subunit
MKSNNLHTKLRVIWAIATKDITDAVRNKAIISSMVSVLLIVVMYQWGPDLIAGSEPPVLALYDAGESRLVSHLEDSLDLELIEATSQDTMEKRLGFEQFPSLGLVLPPDLDQSLSTEGSTPIELAGYVDHWVTEKDTLELQTFFEGMLTELTGKPVRIVITRDIYTRTDGGNPFMVSLLLIVILTMMSITTMTHLMIEEKETRTMDALLVSPATPTLVLMGKIIAGLFYCLACTAIVLLLNSVYIVHWDVIIAACLCGAAFSASLGALMGSVLKTKQQVSLWGFLLLQPLILPVAFSVILADIAPGVVAEILRWVPTVALAEIIRLSFVAQAPFSAFVWQLVLVLASTIVLMGAGLWLTRRAEK